MGEVAARLGRPLSADESDIQLRMWSIDRAEQMNRPMGGDPLTTIKLAAQLVEFAKTGKLPD